MEKLIGAAVVDARTAIFDESFAKLVQEFSSVIDDVMDEHGDLTKSGKATPLFSSTDICHETTAKHYIFQRHYSEDATSVVSTSCEKLKFPASRITHIIQEQYRTLLMKNIQVNMMNVT